MMSGCRPTNSWASARIRLMSPPGTPPWPRRGYRPRRRSGHPTGPQFGYHPAPKLSVGLHAVDAPDYLAGLDHVVIVPGQHGGGRGSWHAAGRQHLYDDRVTGHAIPHRDLGMQTR
jgi:hypothetical protein